MAAQSSDGFGLQLPEMKNTAYPESGVQLSMSFTTQPKTEHSNMKTTKRTLLLALLSRCRKVFEDTSLAVYDVEMNVTFSNTTVSPFSDTNPTFSTPRETYDNAYFYILFVMLFYSFLAMTLFKCFISSNEERTDPYEEFVGPRRLSTQTFNEGHMAEKFYFEEECSL